MSDAGGDYHIAAENDAGVVIDADAQSPHQAVIDVMEAARLAGIVHITFSTQRRSGAR